MANWVTPLTAAASGDLHPGEEIVAAIFLQPGGTATRMVARGMGGVVGAAIASRMSGTATAPLLTDVGTAAKLPDRALVVGLTDRRLIAYGHSMLSGRPKGLQLILHRDQLVRVESEPQTTSWSMLFHFADGTSSVYEAPKIGNDVEAFVAAANG